MARIPSLEEAKEHLRVDPEYLDEDPYIQSLIPRAVDWAERFCDASIGDMKPGIEQAILMKIGDFYDADRNSYSGLKETLAAEKLAVHYRKISF